MIYDIPQIYVFIDTDIYIYVYIWFMQYVSEKEILLGRLPWKGKIHEFLSSRIIYIVPKMKVLFRLHIRESPM